MYMEPLNVILFMQPVCESSMMVTDRFNTFSLLSGTLHMFNTGRLYVSAQHYAGGQNGINITIYSFQVQCGLKLNMP
ncbi:MAG: hypothetical protein AMDU2_EPLC00006G0132 [Thermoplasmatales archaeon E-plasma]|jgi:hypothetical protein|nr:MAG: hypothetical protein AMDU2_EPLC00006G0132 [Thermoplasmatales archaeon E-plasma]